MKRVGPRTEPCGIPFSALSAVMQDMKVISFSNVALNNIKACKYVLVSVML